MPESWGSSTQLADGSTGAKRNEGGLMWVVTREKKLRVVARLKYLTLPSSLTRDTQSAWESVGTPQRAEQAQTLRAHSDTCPARAISAGPQAPPVDLQWTAFPFFSPLLRSPRGAFPVGQWTPHLDYRSLGGRERTGCHNCPATEGAFLVVVLCRQKTP